VERVARRAVNQVRGDLQGVELPLTALVLSGVLCFFAVGALTAALVLGLANIMPAWAGALIAAVLMGAGGYALLRYARSLPLPPALQGLRTQGLRTGLRPRLRPEARPIPRPISPSTPGTPRVTAPHIPP
jgi:hypothetical protein